MDEVWGWALLWRRRERRATLAIHGSTPYIERLVIDARKPTQQALGNSHWLMNRLRAALATIPLALSSFRFPACRALSF